jgi:hypothetical protein
MPYHWGPPTAPYDPPIPVAPSESYPPPDLQLSTPYDTPPVDEDDTSSPDWIPYQTSSSTTTSVPWNVVNYMPYTISPPAVPVHPGTIPPMWDEATSSPPAPFDPQALPPAPTSARVLYLRTRSPYDGGEEVPPPDLAPPVNYVVPLDVTVPQPASYGPPQTTTLTLSSNVPVDQPPAMAPYPPTNKSILLVWLVLLELLGSFLEH